MLKLLFDVCWKQRLYRCVFKPWNTWNTTDTVFIEIGQQLSQIHLSLRQCKGKLVLKSDQYIDGADEKSYEPHVGVWQCSRARNYKILTFLFCLFSFCLYFDSKPPLKSRKKWHFTFNLTRRNPPENSKKYLNMKVKNLMSFLDILDGFT